MFTERTHPTRLRLRRTVAGVCLAGVALSTAGVAVGSPAGAAPVAADETARVVTATKERSLDAARRVAERRASVRRQQVEVAQAQAAVFLADLAAKAQADRVGAVLAKGDTALGRPYVRGASGPNAFDCSGFTRWAWQAAGVELPHYSGAQWAMAEKISIDELQPGDLVFYWAGGAGGDPSHVGLYVGDGQMIHAPGSGRNVRYESIWYWSSARVAAGRVG